MTTNNPFDARRHEQPPEDPIQKLHDHVAKLNNYRWVRAGNPYFVASRIKPDGTTEHYVERGM